MLNGCLFLIGLLSLAMGAHFLVHRTAQLANRWQVSPVFLSIVLLGMGTSAPEWFVTVMSALKGLPDVAIGNVIGSNIANVLLILGLTGWFHAHREEKQIKLFSLPFLLAAFVVLFLLFRDGLVDRGDGLLLFALFILYLFLLIRNKGLPAKKQKLEPTAEPLWKPLSFLLLGFVLLFAGSELTVSSGVSLGKAVGFSERFIGLFLVSVGTSLPELATTLASVLKNQEKLVLGNIVGSNIFNTLFVLSSAAVIQPVRSSNAFAIDYLVMFCVCLLLLFFLFVFRKLPKPAALGFLIAYVIYLCFTGGFLN